MLNIDNTTTFHEEIFCVDCGDCSGILWNIANTGVMHMHVSSSHLSLYIAEAIWNGMFFSKVMHEAWNGHDVEHSIQNPT